MTHSHELLTSYDDLMKKSHQSAREYLIYAISNVNDLMGDGAAQKHPEIVAALVQAAATDYAAMMLSHRVAPQLLSITRAIADLQRSVDRIGGK